VARRLRNADPPVLGRIENDQMLLDPRTVFPEQEATMLAEVEHALAGGGR
jgi:L-seryl-tRNA(Ser) seleniumtransferase